MKTILRAAAWAVLSIAFLSLPAPAAVGTYTTSFSNTTSISVTNAQHGMGSKNYAVNVYDSSGALMPTSYYSYSINTSTYALSLSFSFARSGTLKLVGPFTGVTSSANDFATERDAVDHNLLRVCASCSTTSPALRGHNGAKYGLANQALIGYNWGVGGTVRIWMEGNQIVAGISQGSASAYSLCSSGSSSESCRVEYGISSFPVGVLPIATWNYTQNNGFAWSGTDNRPW